MLMDNYFLILLKTNNKIKALKYQGLIEVRQ